MSESTLTYTLGDIQSEVGALLGISRTVADWTAENTADVGRIIKAGQRQFYDAHDWNFLTASLSVTTSNGTAQYDLPADFGGFPPEKGRDRVQLFFTSTKDWPLWLVPKWEVDESVQRLGTSMPTGISQPLKAYVQSKTATLGTTGQRYTINLWPTPTSTTTITGRYRINPDALATTTHYPLGGEIHSQTLLESCLAAAEEYMNDTAGIHRQMFDKLLQQSIQNDSRLHAQEAA